LKRVRGYFVRRLLALALLSFGSVSYAAPDAALPAPVSSATNAPADYILGASDKVRITVYNEPTLTGEYSVNAKGTLAVPLIGDVTAQGRTTDAIKAEIETKLSDGYLKFPQVSIEVLSFRPYYILGEVNKPGEYPYSNGLTVLNAVATAQGFTYRAKKSKVFIKHAGEQVEAGEDLTSSTLVRPGDTIRIGERYF